MPPTKAMLVALALALVTHAVSAQRPTHAPPDLQGFWTSGTTTPLQRPADLAGKEFFSESEAAEYERTWPERTRDRLPTPDDRLTQADVDDTYVESEAIKLDGLRTSLIVEHTGAWTGSCASRPGSRVGPSRSWFGQWSIM